MWKTLNGRSAADGNPLTTRRWRRYGHDRLYFKAPGGNDVGYYDLLKDRPVVDDDLWIHWIEMAFKSRLKSLSSAPD